MKMRIVKNNIKYDNYCTNNFGLTFFEIGVLLLTARGILGQTVLDASWMRIFTYIGYILIFFKISFTRYELKEYAILLGLIVLGLINYIHCKSAVMLVNIIFIYAAKAIDIKKIINYISKLVIAIIILIFAMSLLGKVPIIVKGNLAFGFTNPNLFMAWCIVAYIYETGLKIEKINFIFLFCISGILITLSFLTESRTSFFICLFEFILALSLKTIQLKKGIENLKFEKIYFLIILLIFFSIIFYTKNGVLGVVDALASGRLQQAHYYFLKYGINMWGNNIVELSSDYEYWHYVLDCGYARLFINYGLVWGIIYVMLHYKLIKMVRMQGDLQAIAIIMGFALNLIMENGGLGWMYNMAIVFVGNLIWYRNVKEYKLGNRKVLYKLENK